MTHEQQVSASQYEEKYKEGYGLVYPESHVIRIHRHVLEWELGLSGGNVFDFGCGSGGHLKYFADHGFTPYGCDVSKTAIERCKALLPKYASNFFVTPPSSPKLQGLLDDTRLDIFFSNQVLYYFEDGGIKDITAQAFDMVKPGGIFIATMISYSCWYARYITGERGDFKIVEMDSPRIKETTYLNFKNREDLESLFAPFRKLHVGMYTNDIREEEGGTDHWIYIGIRD